MTHESLTKTELNKMLVMEKTSGNEIINRLVRLKFVEQMRDGGDRRSVRVRITDCGRRQVIQVLPEMQKVSKIVTGNLDAQEVRALTYLLRKLDNYHNNIYHTRKDAALGDLI